MAGRTTDPVRDAERRRLRRAYARVIVAQALALLALWWLQATFAS